MTDNLGDLSGTLTLTAHDVWVADQAVLTQLEQDPNYAGRDADLATNNGPDNQAGFLQAGGIVVDLLGSTFFVQNSGTADELAGISVGDGGLSIVNEGADPATVIGYGREISGGAIIGGSELRLARRNIGKLHSKFDIQRLRARRMYTASTAASASASATASAAPGRGHLERCP